MAKTTRRGDDWDERVRALYAQKSGDRVSESFADGVKEGRAIAERVAEELESPQQADRESSPQA